jgi:hypothetical protein
MMEQGQTRHAFLLKLRELTCFDGLLFQVANEGMAMLGAEQVEEEVQVEEDPLRV